VDTGECLSVLDREAVLLRRGVWLALQREKVPSYYMELKAVLETADLVIEHLEDLREALTERES
jgi:hypothetical protein